MRCLLVLASLGAVAASAGAATADAASAVRVAGAPAAGPAFAAATVAWVERTREYGFAVRAASGGRSRRLTTRAPEPATSLDLRITGGAELIVGITTYDEQVQPGYPPEARVSEHVLLGLDGAERPLQRCEPGQPQDLVQGDGDAAGSVRLACSREVVVRDARGGTEVTMPFRGTSPRLAGRFVAVVAPTTGPPSDIVVYDWRDGREVHRVPTSRLREPVRRLDLRSDGAVAFEHPVAGGVAWSSPARPGIHRLRLPRREAYRVRWHGRAVLYAAGDEQGAKLPRAELGLVALSSRRWVLARNVLVVDEGFDTDGRRIAYVSRRCGLRVVVRGIREREPRCPPRRR
jgi:hypothetical protein